MARLLSMNKSVSSPASVTSRYWQRMSELESNSSSAALCGYTFHDEDGPADHSAKAFMQDQSVVWPSTSKTSLSFEFGG